MSSTERLVRSYHDFNKKNFHSKVISKWRTDLLRKRHMTYPSLPVGDFGYRSQVIFRGVGQRHFPFCSQKASSLTHPSMNDISRYLPTTTRGVTEFSTSFDPSKASYCVLPLWTSDAEFWSGHIMLLTWVIMPHSKPNSSKSANKCDSYIKLLLKALSTW